MFLPTYSGSWTRQRNYITKKVPGSLKECLRKILLSSLMGTGETNLLKIYLLPVLGISVSLEEMLSA